MTNEYNDLWELDRGDYVSIITELRAALAEAERERDEAASHVGRLTREKRLMDQCLDEMAEGRKHAEIGRLRASLKEANETVKRLTIEASEERRKSSERIVALSETRFTLSVVERERDEARAELEMRRIDREEAQDDADVAEAIDESRLIEELAEYAHNAWAGWMQYLFSKCERRTDKTYLVPLWAVDRWWRQMQTDYSDLPDNEKESDRVEARKMLSIVQAERGHAGKE